MHELKHIHRLAMIDCSVQLTSIFFERKATSKSVVDTFLLFERCENFFAS